MPAVELGFEDKNKMKREGAGDQLSRAVAGHSTWANEDGQEANKHDLTSKRNYVLRQKRFSLFSSNHR